MGSPTLQTLQEPIFLLPWSAFEMAAFQTLLKLSRRVKTIREVKPSDAWTDLRSARGERGDQHESPVLGAAQHHAALLRSLLVNCPRTAHLTASVRRPGIADSFSIYHTRTDKAARQFVCSHGLITMNACSLTPCGFASYRGPEDVSVTLSHRGRGLGRGRGVRTKSIVRRGGTEHMAVHGARPQGLGARTRVEQSSVCCPRALSHALTVYHALWCAHCLFGLASRALLGVSEQGAAWG